MTSRTLASALALTCACTTTPDAEGTDTHDGGSSGPLEGSSSEVDPTEVDPSAADGSTSGAEGSSGEPDPAEASAFFVSIAGLWVAPVTSWTSAGSFPTMNMDVRAASDGVLFSRVDLDGDNSLRFAFALEEHDGQTVLTFRNGGDFLGIPRDTRTALEESDGTLWRFCALGGGCDYVDARFDFSQDDTLRLDVDVLGMRHIEWIASRLEARPLEGAFPTPPAQPGDADFPAMPELAVQASWSEPLAEPADIWVVLTTTDCGVNPLENCVPSRYMRATADAGSTSVVVAFEQIHDGDYRANAVLDRNRNMTAGILLPDMGDAVSFPLDVPTQVPQTGMGTVDLLLSVEL
ncbi:MAG: hypothetical protein ACE37F_26990 [Nannocystaceae bacterium]|nr:hypothetical protein [bacterium]